MVSSQTENSNAMLTALLQGLQFLFLLLVVRSRSTEQNRHRGISRHEDAIDVVTVVAPRLE